MISILLPFKNAESWIDACLKSIREQDYADWEVLAVDDGSEDQSTKIAKRFCQDDARFKLFANKGVGILPALQTAFQNASGNYVHRMDADDLMPPGKLSKLNALLKDAPDRTVATGCVTYFSEKSVSPGYQKYAHWLNDRCKKKDHWNHIYRECVIASPNWLAKTEDIRAIDGFNQLVYPEDYDLVFAWYRNGFQIKCTTDVTHLWREHPARTSRHSPYYQQPAFFSLKLHHFIQNELVEGENLALVGINQKAILTASFLLKKRINFQWWVMPGEKRNPLPEIPKLEIDLSSGEFTGKILLAVYPDNKARESMEEYFHRHQLIMGKSYWYL